MNLPVNIIEGWVNKINQETDRQKIIRLMQTILNSWKEEEINKCSKELKFKKKESPNLPCSHFKEVIYKKTTKWGDLSVEMMLFTGEEYTGFHTHPEFVVDKILEGRLIEIDENGDVDHRKEGCVRSSFDPKGMPHNVKGDNGTCVTLCCYLGFNPVSKMKYMEMS